MHIVAGVDLGGTAVNYTLIDGEEQFLIEGLCEHPALSKQGPDICLQQIEDGLAIAAAQGRHCALRHRCRRASIRPARPARLAFSAPAVPPTSSIPTGRATISALDLEQRLGKPVNYLNDGNAGALWGHFTIFGGTSRETSISAIIGTGLGGGVIVEGNVVKGRKGFGGELGHVLIPYQSISRHQGLDPECNCGRTGCLESVCSLTAIERSFLPYFLARYPGHNLGKLGDLHKAAKMVRGLAEKGDPMCVDIFRVQAHALGLFFDEMVNTFDPDALIVGGGAIETGEDFQRWFTGRSAPACRPNAKSRRTSLST